MLQRVLLLYKLTHMHARTSIIFVININSGFNVPVCLFRISVNKSTKYLKDVKQNSKTHDVIVHTLRCSFTATTSLYCMCFV